MIILAHAVTGVAAAYIAALPILPALLGSVVVDADFFWAVDAETHRAWFHTPVVGVLLSVLLFFVLKLVRDRIPNRLGVEPSHWAYAFLAGWMMHLAGDALTTYGIMLLFPLSDAYYTAGWFRSVELGPNALATVLALTSMWVAFIVRRKRLLRPLRLSTRQRFLSLLIVMCLFFLAVERPKSDFPLSAEVVPVSSLVSSPSAYDERYVATEGRVVQILPDYVTESGRKYDRFYLGDPATNEKILVFKSAALEPGSVTVGQRLVVSGLFSTKFGEPEIQVFPVYGTARAI